MKKLFILMTGFLLPLITFSTLYGQYGNNAKNGTDSKPESYFYSAGVTPVNPYTGNVHTEIKDLEIWGAAGDVSFSWMRYGNSRSGHYSNVYGTAHNWNASFMYEMQDAGTNGQGRQQLRIHYPEGGENIFIQDANDPDLWLPEKGIGKRLFKSGDIFYLQTANGFRYRFEKLSTTYYQLQDFKDSHQNLYSLYYQNKRLIKIIEPAGRYFEIIYGDAGGKKVITKVASSDGRIVQYHYTSVNGWVSLTDVLYDDGTQAVYSYNSNTPPEKPVLSHAIDPRTTDNATDMKYTYNANAGVTGFMAEQRNGADNSLMATLTTENGKRTVCYMNRRIQEYLMPENLEGLVTEYTDGLGRTTKYEYDNGGKGFIKSITDPLLRTTVYDKLTIYGNVLRLIYPDMSKAEWERDDLDLITSYTDALKRTTIYHRNSLHLITTIDFPDGTHEGFTYNPFGQVEIHTGRNMHTETFDYDTRALMKHYTDAMGYITYYTYDAADRLASIKDARSNTMAYEYNARGQVTKQINTDLSFKIYGYDDFGNKTISANELYDSTIYTYDAFRRMLTQQAPMGRGTIYSYDLPGGGCGCLHDRNKPTRITRPTGKAVAYEYDVEWQKTKDIKGAGSSQEAVTQYQYDAAGNVTIMIDPNGNDWEYGYDARDRKIFAAAPLADTTEWVYDAVGNVLQTIRPDGGITENSYDKMDRLKKTIDPKMQVTKFDYDAEGNAILLTDPGGNTTIFDYDPLSRKTKMIYPDGSFEGYSYDEAGNLKTYTNRKADIRTYTYDSRNREIHSEWNTNTSPVDRAYDVVSRVRSIINKASTINYVYNAAGELTGERQKIKGTSTKNITYRSNADGLRDSLVYPDGTSVTYEYNSRELISDIYANDPTPLVKYRYDLNGNRIYKELENGVKTTYEYDAANRLLILDNRNNAGSVSRFDYGYDKVNRRTYAKRDHAKGDVYNYDAIDQVTGVQYDATDPDTNPTNPSATDNYTYDSNGNRKTMNRDGNITNYKANNLNQYTKAGAASLKYDTTGNLTKYNKWNYTYDAENRLIKADSASTTASFEYDAFNRCVKRTINGTATLFYYDDWNLIEERNINDQLLAKYIHGARIDEILKRITTGANIYAHQDALNNTTAITDNNASIKETYRYNAFGTPTIQNANGVTVSASTVSNRFMYTGREYIQELGLYDYRNRVYSAILGRFLQTDPIGFLAMDYNLYRYVFNSAANMNDSKGLSAAKWATRILGAAGLGLIIIGAIAVSRGALIPGGALVIAGGLVLGSALVLHVMADQKEKREKLISEIPMERLPYPPPDPGDSDDDYYDEDWDDDETADPPSPIEGGWPDKKDDPPCQAA